MRVLAPFTVCALLCACSSEGNSGGSKALQVEVVLLTASSAHHPMDAFFDIAFADANTGYAVGSNAIFYKTVDGGGSWSLQPVPAVIDNPKYEQLIRAIHFESLEMGFVSGHTGNQGYIAKSTDKGQTWTIKTPAMTEYAEEIEFNGNIGLAAGHSGFVMRSADGGETWTKITTVPSTENFDRIFMDDPSRFYLQSRINLYFSTDQGLTWTVAPSTAEYAANLRMQSATIGYSYIGDRLSKTTDGANTWSTVWQSPVAGGGYDGDALMVPEPGVLCFSQTRQGAFYISRDAGASYETYAIPETPTAAQALTHRTIWPKYAVNGDYLFVISQQATPDGRRQLYRIKYK